MVVNGDTGIFFPASDFNRQEIKRFHHIYSIGSAQRLDGEVKLLQLDNSRLSEALRLKTEQSDMHKRTSEIYKASYEDLKKENETTVADLKADLNKAKNGSKFWKAATAVVAAVGTTLYFVK
jgi:hypothetical protein